MTPSFLAHLNVKALLGVEGVSEFEHLRARQIGRYLSYAVLIALLVVVVQLVLDYSGHQDHSPFLSIGVWIVFTLELCVNMLVVKNKKRYLLHNWLNGVIILVAFPWLGVGQDWAVLFRSLRLLLFLRIILNAYWSFVALLRQNSFGLVLFGALVFVVVAGAIFSVIERMSFVDGVWYALVTITTVGYGDLVPLTDTGRIFGAVLIVVGVMLFSLVTANVSAFLIGSEQKNREKEILTQVRIMQSHLEQMSETSEQRTARVLEHVSDHLDRLEHRIESLHVQSHEKNVRYHEAKIQQENELLFLKVKAENKKLLAEVKQLIEHS